MIENIDVEDGYRIVNMYLEKDFNDKKFPKKVHNSIFKKVGSEYYQKIFSKYDIDKDKKLENIPVWEFLEIITFGELVNFYEFFLYSNPKRRVRARLQAPMAPHFEPSRLNFISVSLHTMRNEYLLMAVIIGSSR